MLESTAFAARLGGKNLFWSAQENIPIATDGLWAEVLNGPCHLLDMTGITANPGKESLCDFHHGHAPLFTLRPFLSPEMLHVKRVSSWAPVLSSWPGVQQPGRHGKGTGCPVARGDDHLRCCLGRPFVFPSSQGVTGLDSPREGFLHRTGEDGQQGRAGLVQLQVL